MPAESKLSPVTLTPRQQETVNKFLKVGDKEGADRWTKEFLSVNAEASKPVTPIIPKTVTPPDTLDMVIPWSEGETIASRPILPKDRMDAQTAASQKLQQDYIRQGYTSKQSADMAGAKLKGIQSRVTDTEGRNMTGQGISVPVSKKKIEELTGLEAVKEAFKPQMLVSPEQAKQIDDRNAEIVKTRDMKMKDIESKLPVGLSPVDRRAKVEAMYKDDIQSSRPKVMAYAKEHYKEIVGTDPVGNDAELLGLKMYNDYVSDYAPSLKSSTGWDKAKSAASQSLINHLTTKDPKTGAISENYFGTAARDVGGLWRIILDPAMQAITYEVDDQGNQINKDDIGFIPAQRTKVVTKGTEEGRPVASDSESFLTDVSVSIAKGRSLGDDFMDITPEFYKDTTKGGTTLPYWVGMALEVALPLSPLGAVGDIVSAGTKGAARVVETAGLRAVATGLRAVAEPIEAVRTATAKGLSKAALSEVADAKTAIRDVDALGDAHSVRATTARIIADDAVKMADELKSLPDTGIADIDSIKHPILKKAAKRTFDRGELLTKANLERAIPEVSSIPMKLASSLLRTLNNIGVGPTDYRLTILKKELLQATQEGLSKGLDDVAAVEYGTQRVISDVLSEHFLNAVPDDMIFVTPTTVVTRKAWRQVGKDVVKRTQTGMEATPIRVGDETHFKLTNPDDIRRYLSQVASGPVGPQSSFMADIFKKLDSNSPLTQAEYLEVYNKVLSNETLAATVAAKDLKYTGLAAEKAAVPVERRIPILRSAQDIYRGVSQAIQGVKADSFMAKLNPRSPLVVKNMVEEIKGLSARITNSFTSELKVAEGATPLERFENTIKSWSGSTDTLDDWEDFINQYFSGGSGLYPEQIKRIVGTGKRLEKSADVVEVLRAVREENQTLKGVGYKQRGIKATYDKALGRADDITDDIFAAQTTFAVGRRQKAQVAQAVRNLLERNPELGYALRDRAFGPDTVAGIALRARIGERLVDLGIDPDMFFKNPKEVKVPNLPREVKAPKAPKDPTATSEAAVAEKAETEVDYQNKMTRFYANQLVKKLFKIDDKINQLKAARYDKAVQKSEQVAASRLAKYKEAVQKAEDLKATRLSQAENRAAQQTQAAIDSIRRDIVSIYERVADDKSMITRLISDKITEGSTRAGNWQKALGIPKERLTKIEEKLREVFEEVPGSDTKTQAVMAEFFNPIIDLVEAMDANIAGNMTHWGVVDEVGGIKNTLKHLQPELMGIEVGSMIPMIGKDLAKEITDIQDAIKSGAFSKNMSSLITKDPKGAAVAAQAVVDVLKSSRSMMIGGMLGGNWIPNGRFLINNFVTAPLIMNITTGLKATAGSTMRLIGDLVPKIMNKSVPDATVIFQDSLGRSWTKSALKEMLERNNIKFSQSTFEFAESDIESIRRSAKITADKAGLKDASQVEQMMRWIDPRNKSVWNQLGEDSDNLWRQSAFLQAIKTGKTELEAADIARNSMLDYSQVTPLEREVLGQFVMFYAFRRQMTSEVVHAIARNPSDIRRLLVLHKEQQKRQHLWEFGNVYAQTRFMGFNQDKIWDDTMAGSYGPGDPAMSAFSDILMAIGAITRGNVGELVSGLKGEAFTPEFALAGSIAKAGSKGTGYVPPAQVNALMELGVWQDFMKLFHVEPIPYVDPDYRRQGEPTFKQKSELTDTGLSKIGMQYRFADAAGYNRYLALVYAMTRLGLMRSINDVATTGLVGGATPDGVTRKRFEGGAADAALYTLGIKTPMKVDTSRSAEFRASQKALKDLKDLSKP